MSLAHLYTEFGADLIGASPGTANEDALEDIRLQAFEHGYKAGWDDAAQVHETEQGQIAADLAQNFQDMSFTYHEAHAKLTRAMTPLLTEMVSKLLPELAQQTLGLHVLEQLSQLVDAQTDSAIEIAVATENIQSIRDLLAHQVDMPFDIVAEPALSPGQVYLRAGTTERELNLDNVVSGISEAVAAFFHQTQQESAHG